jgi:hypothetical protein
MDPETTDTATKPAETASPAPSPAAAQELIETRRKLEAAESRERKRQAAEKAADDAKRLETEEAKKVVAERNTEVAALREKLAAIETKEKERADSLLSKLPQAAQDKLGKFRDKLSTTDFLDLIEAEGATMPAESPTLPPPTGSVISPKAREAQGHQPSPRAAQMLDELGFSTDTLRSLQRKSKTDEVTGSRVDVFSVDGFRDMFGDRMKKVGAKNR